MRNVRNLSHIKSMIRHSGVTVKNAPSISHPIPVAVFYRNNAAGTIAGFWPKGNRQTALASYYSRPLTGIAKWAPNMYAVFFALGMERLLAHGRFVVYTDLPTATYLQQQWRGE